MPNFAFPSSSSEALALMVLLIALIGGILTLVKPRMIMAWTGLQDAEGRRFGLSEIRGPLGGFYVGVALFVLFSPDRPYLIFAFAFGFACFGRILAFILDGVRSRENVLSIAGDAMLATIPLLHTMGGFWFLEAILGW